MLHFSGLERCNFSSLLQETKFCSVFCKVVQGEMNWNMTCVCFWFSPAVSDSSISSCVMWWGKRKNFVESKRGSKEGERTEGCVYVWRERIFL